MGYWKFRKNKRAENSKAVFYLDRDKDTSDRSFFAMTVNVSECGACILTDRPVEEGDVFLLESALWKNTRAAKTVWAKCIGNSLFEAGLALC